jgi:DNA (cytosine-5)-methyltransferase 1
MIEREIQNVDPREIRRKVLAGRDIDLLVVCAPCQPFSSQNQKRGADGRARLILQAGRFAKHLRPKIIFFENVPGLASNKALLKELKRELGKDYVLGTPQRIDAADYGVPQRRVRCIMIATRGCNPPPAPPPMTPEQSRVTVRDAIGHLPRLRSGEADPHDPLHVARKHQPIALRRLAAIPKDGGSRSSLPPELILDCHTGVGSGKFSDVYGRMGWKSVAPTLTTGCTDLTRGRFAHPDDDRAITAREAALLQTFPPDYEFTGSIEDIQTQIGNAVPMRLVEALVPMFRQTLSELAK